MDLLAQPGTLAGATLLALLVGKYLFTTASFASGAPGGTLFPLVVMGSLSGALFGIMASTFFGFPEAYVVNFLLLGVAGLFSSVVRAPVTAVVLWASSSPARSTVALSAAIVSIVSYVDGQPPARRSFYDHLAGAASSGVTPNDPSMNGAPGEKVPQGSITWGASSSWTVRS